MHAVGLGDITRAAENFLRLEDGQTPTQHGRERSWDFCYNYFQASPLPTKEMELSCLQLGYYLASWGMMRGSSYLFKATNVRHYREAIETVERYNPRMQDVDAHRYAEQDVQNLLLDAYSDLRKALVPADVSHLTLVTKVMMGVWGVLPSFDTYFIRGFRALGESKKEQTAFLGLSHASLDLLGHFYSEHAMEIDTVSERLTTLDFTSGKFTSSGFSRAKVIEYVN
ncbi:hypothetical protein FHR86_003818 [Paenarthrobacter ilicis]|uniref:Uncharacterized protein n=1 Tax=Paenarthrobacter ilicis TaxID=43665 RepID=A0ABX0TMS0_9MICC|nr:hypothetical protein [Paenarthrobacter ilicis]NIJ03459.1 hypothetical protein [Paenarthrobacter ilicis]